MTETAPDFNFFYQEKDIRSNSFFKVFFDTVTEIPVDVVGAVGVVAIDVVIMPVTRQKWRHI